MPQFDVYAYCDSRGRILFEEFLDSLEPAAARRISAALPQFERGNFSDFRHVGDGVLERRIHSGPGYRIYFGIRGRQVVVLTAGTKRTQRNDLRKAKELWNEQHSRESS